MKISVLVCVLMLAGSAAYSTESAQDSTVETGTFEEARAVGTFFLFSTSYGRYVIRHDGMGEVTFGARRRAFWVKRGMAGRVERVYFQEYEGELLLLYQVNGNGYIARMHQQSRKVRWITPVTAPCKVAGDEAHCDGSNINLTTGARVNPD